MVVEGGVEGERGWGGWVERDGVPVPSSSSSTSGPNLLHTATLGGLPTFRRIASFADRVPRVVPGISSPTAHACPAKLCYSNHACFDVNATLVLGRDVPKGTDAVNLGLLLFSLYAGVFHLTALPLLVAWALPHLQHIPTYP